MSYNSKPFESVRVITRPFTSSLQWQLPCYLDAAADPRSGCDSCFLCDVINWNSWITGITCSGKILRHNQTLSQNTKINLFPITKFDLDYDERSSHTSVIREHYVFLLETLDAKISGLVHELYAKEVVTGVERDDIIAEMTSFRANEKLLSVLSRKSPQQFQLFLQALDNCGQQHVRNVVDDRRGLSTLSRAFVQI